MDSVVPTKTIRCAPKRFPCPSCGQLGRRKGYHTRTVVDIEYGRPAYIQLTVGEYRAVCNCCRTFRATTRANQLAVEPRAKYTTRVREAVLARLFDDGMNIERLRAAMQRDFHLPVSEGFVYDCLDWKVRHVNLAEFRAASLKRFSGTLNVDELHLGHRTLLLATDPLANGMVSFALVSRNDHEHLYRFLNKLKTHGFQPKIVVSDGSPLYPSVLADVWPNARHQLCVFHLIKDLYGVVLEGLRHLRREGFPPSKLPKRRRGRPKKSEQQRVAQVQQQRERSLWIWQHRYLLVTKRTHLTPVEQQNLALMLEYLPTLRVLRQFVDDLEGLFDPTISKRQAACRYARMQGKRSYQTEPHVRKALKKLPRAKFEKALTYLDWTHRTLTRTNNHVERTNRQLRLWEKVRYCWRRRRTIIRFLVLAIYRHEETAKLKPAPPQKRLRKSANSQKHDP